MGLLDRFKLEKVKIVAYLDPLRSTSKKTGEMVVMFNPSTYSRKHAIAYTGAVKANPKTHTKAERPSYAYTPPGEVSFKFIFDGTGVASMGVQHIRRVLGGASVAKDVKTFEELCLRVKGDSHQPAYLRIYWGAQQAFEVRLKTLDIKYTLFAESGEPLRAELDATFIEDKHAKKQAAEKRFTSPDVTHMRVVKSGDTLPGLCREIYGSPEYYLRVAADNELDDFRNLTPGQKLRFAPLTSGEDTDLQAPRRT